MDQVKKSFLKFYDSSGSGFIEKGHLVSVMATLGFPESKASEVLAMVDKNGDGRIDYHEFVEWVMGEGGQDAPDEFGHALGHEITKLPAGKYLLYVFDDYHGDGAIVENSDVNIGKAAFELTMTVTPSDYALGIIASHDRSFENIQHFRLLMFPSGRVNLAAEGIPGGYGHSGEYGDGDSADGNAGWCTDLVTPAPLEKGRPVRIRLVRDVAGTYILFLDGKEISRCALGECGELCNHNCPAFRIGSRFPPDGDAADLPFKGTIRDARLLVWT